MREIKFRAWDSYANKMINHYFVMDSNGNALEISYGHISATLSAYKLMQFTGLKDVNGKEIFESDILKITCRFELRKEVLIDEVIWWEEGSWLCSDWCFFELVSNGVKGEQEWEVIGNIYEHPHLLEQSK